MLEDRVRALIPLALKDLMVVVAGNEAFESALDAVAERRAQTYAFPATATTGEMYWLGLAAALAPVSPPRWLPMNALFESGVTLEGGAKGLRGLFTAEPSDKERRRVMRAAGATARILEMVAGSDASVSAEERRLISMTMASFGLSSEELAQTRPTGAVNPTQFEVPSELDTRGRRGLLRGAWQLALSGRLETSESDVLHAIAAHLELSADATKVREGVLNDLLEQGEMSALAVEIVRGPAQRLAPEVIRPWLEHLIDAAVPVTRKAELSAVAFSTAPVNFTTLPRLSSTQRRQGFALAYATLLARDPSYSASLTLKAELASLAAATASVSDAQAAFHIVDEFLLERTKELQRLASEQAAVAPTGVLPSAQVAATAPATPATSTAPSAPASPAAAASPASSALPKSFPTEAAFAVVTPVAPIASPVATPGPSLPQPPPVLTLPSMPQPAPAAPAATPADAPATPAAAPAPAAFPATVAFPAFSPPGDKPGGGSDRGGT